MYSTHPSHEKKIKDWIIMIINIFVPKNSGEGGVGNDDIDE
jgi:hypothetical protein